MGYELTHKFGRFSTGPNQPILGHTKLEPYPNLALKPFLEGITIWDFKFVVSNQPIETSGSSFGHCVHSLKQILSKECGLVLPPKKRLYASWVLLAGTTLKFPSVVTWSLCQLHMWCCSCYVIVIVIVMSIYKRVCSCQRPGECRKYSWIIYMSDLAARLDSQKAVSRHLWRLSTSWLVSGMIWMIALLG